MSDWWVRAHWGRIFEVLDIRPRIHNQSWALMRKRDVERSVEDLEKPDDDPREYVAARHNVRQIQREVELAEGGQAASLRELRQTYERSLSWQITRPLRAGARRLRSLRARRLKPPGTA